jgi:tRNA pseudouridine38-40 synthase
MRNLRLLIEYDGTGYAGFQRQPRQPTIQGELERALGRLLGEAVRVVGAGRTDAGVHATGQVAHLLARGAIPAERVAGAVNRLLPRQIVVRRAEEAPLAFHARRDAVARRYRYTVFNRPGPSAILGRFGLVVAEPLDAAAMEEAAQALVGEHDFRSFQKSGSETRSTVRRLIELRCRRIGSVVVIAIEANAFLYQMARIMVGALLRVGRGEMTGRDLGRLLALADRRQAGPAAPAHGLCLVRVRY